MATPLNYATQYQRALAMTYPYTLYFGKLFSTSNNQIYKPIDAKTIKLPKITTTGRVDGNRDSITLASRNYDNGWETKELKNHRKWNTLVHPVDVMQTNMVATIQNITKTFNEFEKFPEKDRYCVSKIYADWLAAGGVANTTAVTVDNVLQLIDKFMEAADEGRVPVSGRLLYVTPAVNTIIKQAKDAVRYLTATDSVLQRTVSRIDDLEIIIVPSDIMKTVFDFTTGSVPGVGAKQINMFMCHESAILTPEIYSFVTLDQPSGLTEGKYIYFEEAFEDVFILNERKKAIMFNVAA